MDHIMRAVAHNIQKAGFHVTGVFATKPGERPFAYTIGFHLLGHPEIILPGLQDEQFMPTFHNLYNMIQGGARFEHQSRSADIIHGYDVMFIVPGDPGYQLCNMARVYYNHSNFGVLQLVYPDADGRFPWEEEYGLPSDLQDLRAYV